MDRFGLTNWMLPLRKTHQLPPVGNICSFAVRCYSLSLVHFDYWTSWPRPLRVSQTIPQLKGKHLPDRDCVASVLVDWPLTMKASIDRRIRCLHCWHFHCYHFRTGSAIVRSYTTDPDHCHLAGPVVCLYNYKLSPAFPCSESNGVFYFPCCLYRFDSHFARDSRG